MLGLNYTDLHNMQRIICFTDFCRNNEIELTLILPDNDDLLKFWHSWNFFGTIESVAGVSIEALVCEDQTDSLFFDGEYTSQDETVRLLVPSVPPSRKRNFFSFFCDEIQETSKISIPSRERSYWEREEVVDVLHRVFGENFGDNIGCDIVSETLFNSTRHSNSTKLTSASFCKRNKDADRKRNFQLVFWDDGEPIYETLRKPLKEGKSVREYSPKGFRERHYLVSYPDFPETGAVHRAHDDDVRSDNKDSELFLSALFPGVTSKPFADNDAVEAIEKPELRIQRGMGFDFVLETAVHGLGGTVSIRTGRYFAQIEKVKTNTLRDHLRKVDPYLRKKKEKTGKDAVVPDSLLQKYQREYFSVNFRQMPENIPPLNGNLVSINVSSE